VADISYQPEFRHATWLNFVHKVQADGLNGFNIRFDTIEKDLHAVSPVVGRIGAALNDLTAQTPPPGVEQVLALQPDLLPVPPNPPWIADDNGGAVWDFTKRVGRGVLNVSLPDGALLTKFAITGDIRTTFVGAATFRFTVQLLRAPVRVTIPPAQPQVLAPLSFVGTIDFPLKLPLRMDQSFDIAADLGRVDLSAFRYYVVAAADVSAAPGSFARFDGFQLTYKTA
jgi:hypothetical protein